MTKDEDRRTEELDFVRANAEYIAGLADGHFMDPTVRPKKDRVAWTYEFALSEILDGIAFWEKVPVQEYATHMRGGLKTLTMNALDNQFQIWRSVISYLQRRPDKKLEAVDAAKKQLTRDLRATQADMETFDAKRKCLACGLFMFERDETNNKRHEKDEVCGCNASRNIQAQMRAKTSAYRKGLEHKKKIPKKDPERYKR